MGLLLRQAVFFFSQSDALHKESHIFGQSPHCLQTLLILSCLARLPAMDAVPILAGGYGHAADGEELIQLVKGGGQAASPRCYNTCSNLHGLIKMGAVEQSCE